MQEMEENYDLETVWNCQRTLLQLSLLSKEMSVCINLLMETVWEHKQNKMLCNGKELILWSTNGIFTTYRWLKAINCAHGIPKHGKGKETKWKNDWTEMEQTGNDARTLFLNQRLNCQKIVLQRWNVNSQGSIKKMQWWAQCTSARPYHIPMKLVIQTMEQMRLSRTNTFWMLHFTLQNWVLFILWLSGSTAALRVEWFASWGSCTSVSEKDLGCGDQNFSLATDLEIGGHQSLPVFCS